MFGVIWSPHKPLSAPSRIKRAKLPFYHFSTYFLSRNGLGGNQLRANSLILHCQTAPSGRSKELLRTHASLDFIGPLRLTVAKQTSAWMSLGQWRRSARLAKVSRPSPVPDLRHVFQVLPNIVVMFV